MFRLLVFAILTLLIAGCRTTPPSPEPIDTSKDVASQLKERLSMRRAPEDLGFEERQFDPCEMGMESAPCSAKRLTVIHFQLVCRDSEGTVQDVPVNLTPLKSGRVTWKLGGFSGLTRTNESGHGSLDIVSSRSLEGQRLSLRIGKQFLAFTASELTRVVLPQNFCR
jgi:hypothetical protein